MTALRAGATDVGLEINPTQALWAAGRSRLAIAAIRASEVPTRAFAFGPQATARERWRRPVSLGAWMPGSAAPGA
jgi:hypothetical protein